MQFGISHRPRDRCFPRCHKQLQMDFLPKILRLSPISLWEILPLGFLGKDSERTNLNSLDLKQSVLQLSSFDSIRLATEAGLCIGFLPEGIIDESLQRQELTILEIDEFPEIYWELVLIYHKDMPIDQDSLLFIQFLREHLKYPFELKNK